MFKNTHEGMLGGVSKQIRHDADIDKLVFAPVVMLVTCHCVLW